MTHISPDQTRLLVTLTSDELCRAARLGGYPIALDEQPLDDEEATMELLRFFAKRGITNAIHKQFEHEFPTRYPDDVDVFDWQTSSDQVTSAFSNIWRGKAQW